MRWIFSKVRVIPKSRAFLVKLLFSTGFQSTVLNVRVDHTGIDLIARNPHTNEILGISVTSRRCNPGREQAHVRIPSDDVVKVEAACAAFGCVPYFAIVIDVADTIRVFLLTMEHLHRLCLTETGASCRMAAKHVAQYIDDPNIKTCKLRTSIARWWQGVVVAEPEEIE